MVKREYIISREEFQIEALTFNNEVFKQMVFDHESKIFEYKIEVTSTAVS